MHSKQIAVKLFGDAAIKAEILYVSLGLASESKKDADASFCDLALFCVKKAAESCKNATGIEYPTPLQICEFLTTGSVAQKIPESAPQESARVSNAE